MSTDGAAPLTATAMSQALAAGQVTPGQLLADTLERIGRANAASAPSCTWTPRARPKPPAAEVRQRRGARIGALDGIPVAVKDNLGSRECPHVGQPDVGGLRARGGRHRGRALRAAGAVIVGKTNTPEFALSGRTDSPCTARPATLGTSP